MPSVKNPVYVITRNYSRRDTDDPESFEDLVRGHVSETLDDIKVYCRKRPGAVYGYHGDPEWMYRSEVTVSIVFSPRAGDIDKITGLVGNRKIGYTLPVRHN